MNLNTHVRITVDVLEKMRGVWGQYFEVDDLESLVRDIHAAADALVKDLPHHPGNKVQKRAFYHLMKARYIWLAVVEGKEDPKDPAVVSEFFGNLVLVMHLYQDAVIFPSDMKEHDFMEKKMWEIIKNWEINNRFSNLLYSRKLLKATGFRSYVAYYVDPNEALDQAIGWTKDIAKAVFSGRVISKAEAEDFLIRNGVMKVSGDKNENLGQPIRDRVARRREDLRKRMNLYIKLAALHLVILYFGSGYYFYEIYLKGKSNLLVEIWIWLAPVWIGLLFALFPVKYLLLRRFDKRSASEYERASTRDYYPTHAFFDAPNVYLEYMDGKITPISRKKETKTVKV
ncbi:MAG: hypothetical protein QFX37_00475 [Archaeoglobales archaeon]|nr:hypothetical protein [Archaeoglobales archaeon]